MNDADACIMSELYFEIKIRFCYYEYIPKSSLKNFWGYIIYVFLLYTTPWAIIAFATFRKPAILAPFT